MASPQICWIDRCLYGLIQKPYVPWRLHIPTCMSNIENEDPSTNANGKRVNALELGPRKKAYVIYISAASALI
jgi:hypothetical protein